jgi:hypothetical protein
MLDSTYRMVKPPVPWVGLRMTTSNGWLPKSLDTEKPRMLQRGLCVVWLLPPAPFSGLVRLLLGSGREDLFRSAETMHEGGRNDRLVMRRLLPSS